MKTIYLATDGGSAHMAYNTFNEALSMCLLMATRHRIDYTEKHYVTRDYNPDDKDQEYLALKELKKGDKLEGYAFLWHYCYVIPVEYAEKEKRE